MDYPLPRRELEDAFAFGTKAMTVTSSKDILVELATVTKPTSIHMYKTTTMKFLFTSYMFKKPWD